MRPTRRPKVTEDQAGGGTTEGAPCRPNPTQYLRQQNILSCVRFAKQNKTHERRNPARPIVTFEKQGKPHACPVHTQYRTIGMEEKVTESSNSSTRPLIPVRNKKRIPATSPRLLEPHQVLHSRGVVSPFQLPHSHFVKVVSRIFPFALRSTLTTVLSGASSFHPSQSKSA